METDSCIIFGAKTYTRLMVDDRMCSAHVVVCEMTHGPRPLGMVAAHECGDRRCVNPRHIVWKTPKENTADRLRHGTDLRGPRHPRAKLSDTDILKIQELLSTTDLTQQKIAERFGITQSHVSKIKYNTHRKDNL